MRSLAIFYNAQLICSKLNFSQMNGITLWSDFMWIWHEIILLRMLWWPPQITCAETLKVINNAWVYQGSQDKMVCGIQWRKPPSPNFVDDWLILPLVDHIPITFSSESNVMDRQKTHLIISSNVTRETRASVVPVLAIRIWNLWFHVFHDKQNSLAWKYFVLHFPYNHETFKSPYRDRYTVTGNGFLTGTTYILGSLSEFTLREIVWSIFSEASNHVN